MTLSESQDIV